MKATIIFELNLKRNSFNEVYKFIFVISAPNLLTLCNSGRFDAKLTNYLQISLLSLIFDMGQGCKLYGIC